jgi:hypothetical protein
MGQDMGVEIFILSGVRAGQQIVLDATEFRVGCEANCEVFFDPGHDPHAKGRSALFCLMDDGWNVSSTGIGELLVNQEVVSRRTRIRSGDVLRMSSEGPDLTFSIVSRAAPAAAPAPATAQQTSPSRDTCKDTASMISPSAQGTAAPARSPAVLAPSLARPAPSPAAPATVRNVAEPSLAPTGRIGLIVWTSAIGGGLAAIVLLVCFVSYVTGQSKVALPAPDVVTPNEGTDETRLKELEDARKKRQKALDEKKVQDEQQHRRMEQEAFKKREPAKTEP